MEINHVAVWATDIEALKNFYVSYFGATASPCYHNHVKNFTSYFLKFPGGSTRLEIMNVPEIIDHEESGKFKGLCHIAISVGSKEKVDKLTENMRATGVAVLGNPRHTGDGMYESVISDPEGNLVELTV